MSGQSNAGQEEITPRPRRRTAEHGRILTSVSEHLGAYIVAQAEDLGVSPATMARMMLIEAVKARGLTMKQLEEMYPSPNYAPDKRLRSKRADGSLVPQPD